MIASWRAPETMTADEQARLLKATAAHDDPRDHVLYSMALGNGLRLRELLGLKRGRRQPGRPPDSATGGPGPGHDERGPPRGGIPTARLQTKLRHFLAWKKRVGQTLGPEAPLFLSAQGRRFSPRAAQWRFAWWQERVRFDRRYSFHAMRHSAVTAVYRATENLFLAQRFARHASALTTIVYTHPSDEELYAGVKNLPC